MSNFNVTKRGTGRPLPRTVSLASCALAADTGTNTGTVAWQLGGIAVSSDDSLNTAFGTLVATTALAHSGTSNDLMVSAESGAVTIAGSPATADQVFFQINRDVSADNQSGDARLLGVKIFFTTDAGNDA